MPRICWLTDLHLNFLDDRRIAEFLDSVERTGADAVLIGGDIGEARSVIGYLERIAQALSMPVYFVLGNHDFYFGSIRGVRRRVMELCQRTANLHWLGGMETAELTPRTGLAGCDGWADARLGDYQQSPVMLNDYLLIEELAHHTREARWPLLKQLGDESAEHIRRALAAAAAKYRRVLLLTHVPPFRGACWHEGAISNDDWLPHFSCQVAGEAILEVMRQYPRCQLTVLCGHTHGSGEYRPVENVTVFTGGARYGEPEIQRVLEVE